FAVLGPTLHLGAFATYDAMSVLLVSLATWCVIRPGDRGEATGWMVVASAALALANAAAYSSALFDAVVRVLAVLAGLPAARRAGGAGAAAHPRLAEQARGPRRLVRRDRGRLRGGQVHLGRAGRPVAGGDLRRPGGRADLPHRARGQPVPRLRHRLAQRHQL